MELKSHFTLTVYITALLCLTHTSFSSKDVEVKLVFGYQRLKNMADFNKFNDFDAFYSSIF